MCGIAGEFSFSKPAVRYEAIVPMLESIWHRGPDGWGCYTSPDERVGLYHVRLSIVDLAGGRQPLCNEDGKVWISFNGEIYGHAEVRAELESRGHHFRTRSDTEVIVHLYDEYGEDFVSRLRGEFAFALYDERKGALYLVRDRFGIKPLYFAKTADGLIFGSEIKVILAHGSVTPEFDQEALFNALCSLPIASRTVFKGIHAIEPGSMLKITRDGMKASRYWDLTFPPAEETERDVAPGEEARLIDEFRAELDEAVRIRLVADVEVGVYLSGGLDSSAIAASIASGSGPRHKAFTIGFDDPDYDETQIAGAVAKHLDLDWHTVNVGRGDLAGHFPKSIWHAEIPVPMSSGTAKYLLSRLARQHVKVVLTGEGSDELLCGYPQFKHHRLLEAVRQNPGDSAARKRVSEFLSQHAGLANVVNAREYQDLDTIEKVFANRPYPALRLSHFRRSIRFLQSRAAVQATKNQDVLGLVAQCFDPERVRGIAPLAATQYFLFKTDLPYMLLNWLGDREEMAHSVEGRIPFLDHKLVEFATRLPSSLKLRGDSEKYVLRRAAHDRLPQVMRTVTKKIFNAPSLSTLNFFETEAFRPFLSRQRIQEAGVFSPNAVAFLKLMSRMSKKGSVKYKHYEGALTYVLSVQLLHEMFVRNFKTYSTRFRAGAIEQEWSHNRVERVETSAVG